MNESVVRLSKTIATIVLSFSITGCSVGTNVSKAKLAEFVDNQSTKEDVIKAFGQPESRGVAEGEDEEWTYGYFFIGIPFTNLKSYSRTSVFQFDKRGVLTKHYIRWY